MWLELVEWLPSPDFTALYLPVDFSDRISRSRRVGYESGEFEIVSSLPKRVCLFLLLVVSLLPPLTFEENITHCNPIVIYFIS